MILGLGYLLVVPAVVLARQIMAQALENQEIKEAIALIRGLDGATYMPYSPVVVKKVQETLKALGLYKGENERRAGPGYDEGHR